MLIAVFLKSNKMEVIIKRFKFTKETSQEQIEETLLNVPDFSQTYYEIKKMNCFDYGEVSEKIFNYLQENH
jgi:hypothetical protein